MVKAANMLRAVRYVRTKRDYNIKQVFLNLWLSKCTQRNEFLIARRNLHNEQHLALKRASNLIKVAFVGGLKRFWRDRIIQRDLAKASKFYNRLRLMKLVFKSLQKRLIAKANYKVVLKTHEMLQIKIAYFAWIN